MMPPPAAMAWSSELTRSLAPALPAASVDPERMDRADLSTTLGFNLREAWQEMERCFLECFREEKITPALYAILILVEANPGCRPSDVCREISISPTNIVPYIDDLVARGLLSREVGVNDRRIKLLNLTPEGRDYLQRLRSLHKAIDDQFIQKLGQQNLDRLVELLATITGGPA
jgi:DNA-binding MarR family transcriptional regulator